MRQFVNDLNLPDFMVNFLSSDTYRKSDDKFFNISTTEFILPPQQAILRKRYKESLRPIKASNSLWALIGTIGHHIIEQAVQHIDAVHISEKRFYHEFRGLEFFGDTLTLGGRIDLYLAEEEKLIDFKFVKEQTLRYKNTAQYVEQLLTNAFLLRKNGHKVSQIENHLVIYNRTPNQETCDWYQVLDFTDKLLPEKELEEHVWGRAKRLAELSVFSDEELAEKAPCTAEETYERIDSFTVIKKGGTRGFKFYIDRDLYREAPEHAVEEARQRAEERRLSMKNPNDYEIIMNVTPPVNCLYYCPAAEHCHQFKNKNRGEF